MRKRKPRMDIVWTHTAFVVEPERPVPVWWDEAMTAAFDAFCAVKDKHDPPEDETR